MAHAAQSGTGIILQQQTAETPTTPNGGAATPSTSTSSAISRRSFLGVGAVALAAAAGLTAPSMLVGCSGTTGSTATATENKKFDLLIKGGTVYEAGEGVDLGIKDGIVAEQGSLSEDDAAEVIDASGKLVSPSFVDSHTHLDKAFQMEYEEYREKAKELAAEFMASDEVDYGFPVCGGSERYLMSLIKEGKSEDEIKTVIKERIARALDMAIVNGTCAIKTNNTWGPLSVEVVNELKQEYAGKIDLYNIVPFTTETEAEDRCSMTFDQLEAIASDGSGSIDFIGGYFDGDYGYEDIDAMFDFADKHGLPLDLHVLETDVPLLKPFDYILDKSLAYGVGDKLTCGHLTALDAPGIDPAALEAVIRKSADAKVNVTALTSCNMYLMGRKAARPIRRGMTRLDLFLAANVNTCFASDNIRDAWRPYGNADMLQEAYISAHCLQYAFPEELEVIYRMATVNPAKNALRENYGTGIGCRADLVVLNAPSPDQALLDQAKRLYVIKDGKVVAKDGALV